VATVSDNGTVTWISKGAATITATTVDNGFNATCKVEATDIINIPDINFKDCLFEACSDTNNDGKISLQEAKNITEIDCMVLEIGSLEGIQYYTELTYLDCCYNQLTSIDVSANTKLVQLVCYSNHLSVLNVSHNTKMATLLCGNQKTSYGLNFQQLSLTLLNSQLGMWNIMTSPNSPNYASFNTHVELT
jgi:Leucine-rich repeat (LRR) protein